MARFHVSTSTPTKHEALATWVVGQPWGPRADATIERVGSFHFDDPEGRVGMETHLLRFDGELHQVPLTYRDEELQGGDEAFVAHIEHSALGTRWLYDATRDDRYVMMLAAVALTGQGQALGMVQHDGRWLAVASAVTLAGGGWDADWVAVDGLELVSSDDERVTWHHDEFVMSMWRRPTPAELPQIGLRASWSGEPPVGLVTIVPC